MSKMYLFWSGLAAILIALSGVLRGVESAKPLPVKFSLSVSYLILSFLMFFYRRWKEGSGFHYPWMRPPVHDLQIKYTFSFRQLLAIIGGGVSEFVVSIAVIMSFSAAQKANINQGISSSVMVLNSVIVTILSYCIWREKVSCI